MGRTDPSGLRVNGTRLWESLLEFGTIGATAGGGCSRLALTDEDKAARDCFVRLCREAACRVDTDGMGNIFARRPGARREGPSVLAGSHLDTQPNGGRFDGVYGVLAGLEVIRTLNDADIVTEYPIDIVNWTNEEGVRFSPAMIGSAVWSGIVDCDTAYAYRATNGVSMRDELNRIGYLGNYRLAPQGVRAAFELHIEQGPILESTRNRIGVVTGVQGMRWYDISLTGEACHAGTSPMAGRMDPVAGLGNMLTELYALANDDQRVRMTFGSIEVRPGARNTVPANVTIAADVRHEDRTRLAALEERIRTIVVETGLAHRLETQVSRIWDSPAVTFDRRCVAAVRSAAERCGYSNIPIVSGAGHDSVHIAKVVPTAMIFVPSEHGLSHNEREFTGFDDVVSGANVLLHAILERAGAV